MELQMMRIGEVGTADPICSGLWPEPPAMIHPRHGCGHDIPLRLLAYDENE